MENNNTYLIINSIFNLTLNYLHHFTLSIKTDQNKINIDSGNKDILLIRYKINNNFYSKSYE